jgi:hypothetical protein
VLWADELEGLDAERLEALLAAPPLFLTVLYMRA